MPRSDRLARLALVPLGLVLAVLLVELILQLGAFAVGLGRGDTGATWIGGGRRVLCLGDSNTYGVWLADRRREAYPAQLEALWNESYPEAPIEALNAGYPGTNSSVLLREFPGMVEAFAPDLVIVMVGANDFWTEPVRVEGANGGARGFLRRHSRVYKLFLLLRRRLEPAELEILGEPRVDDELGAGEGVVRFGDEEFPLGWQQKPRPRTLAVLELEENLRALVARARSLGVEALLMTYPSSRRTYASANRGIQAAAAASDARLVELHAVFAPLCPEEDCRDWLFPDQHPRASGYRLVAETLVEALAKVDR